MARILIAVEKSQATSSANVELGEGCETRRVEMDRDKRSDMLEARRRFLMACGKYAAITPPAMAVLLASTRQNYANAGSPRPQGNNGFGNGGGDGTPGMSGSNPSPQAASKSADLNR